MHNRCYYVMHNQKQVHEHVKHNGSSSHSVLSHNVLTLTVLHTCSWRPEVP